MAHCTMTFTKEFFVVTPGVLQEGWQCQDICCKPHDLILPDRREDRAVKATGSVEIPRALGGILPETLDTLFGWDKQSFTVKRFRQVQ